MAKHWTRKQSSALLQGVGVYGIDWFRKIGGSPYAWDNAPKKRSRNAVYAKGRRMYGGGGLTRGSYTLNHVARMTGYSISHLRRAMRALAQKWKRTSKTGNFLIYEEQVDELVGWLQKDYWSKVHHLYNCIWCHREDAPHIAQGLCSRCYYNYRRWLISRGLPVDVVDLLLEVRGLARQAGDPILQKAISNLKRGRAVPKEMFGGCW